MTARPTKSISKNAYIPLRVALTLACMSSLALSQQGNRVSVSDPKVDRLPESLEVALALSAAPQHLRAGATVYVLDPASGYKLERKGTNGFVCYVQRTDYMREDYNNGYVVPECQGPQGRDSIVPVEFDIERLRAEGKMSPSELKAEIGRRFRVGVYHAPDRPGVAYMLSPILGLYDGRSKTTSTMNMPHYMFYAPNLTRQDFGGGEIMGSHPYLINPGPMGYMILHAGAAEKAQINAESQDLLKEACGYRSSFCIPGVTPGF